MPALGIFWAAAASVDPAVAGELRRPGTAPGDLAALLTEAGLLEVRQDVIGARAKNAGFEDWWSPYTLGVGPAGVYTARWMPPSARPCAPDAAAARPPGRPVHPGGRVLVRRRDGAGPGPLTKLDILRRSVAACEHLSPA